MASPNRKKKNMSNKLIVIYIWEQRNNDNENQNDAHEISLYHGLGLRVRPSLKVFTSLNGIDYFKRTFITYVFLELYCRLQVVE